MLECLEGFEKRMEFFAVVESIAKRTNKMEKIENQFEANQLDNLIMSVLTYIMEVTLAEEKECTLEDMVQFVREVLPFYGKQFSLEETEEITRYIVKDILQNKGTIRSYQVMNYKNDEQEISIRLIKDRINENHKIVYELSRQAYDFLFRTKEVDDELGFEFEEIKLKMLIKKKNYQGAIKKSKELNTMLLNRKIEFSQFEERLKTNLNHISTQEYEELINKTNLLMSEEYEQMKEIDDLVTKSKEHLEQEEKNNHQLDDKVKRAKKEVYLIGKNVKTALMHQRELLVQAKNLKKLYLQILEDAMSFSNKKRFNLEEKILKPLEQVPFDCAEQIFEVYKKLVNPLFLRGFSKHLNLNLLYDSQAKIKEQEDEFISQKEEYEEDLRQKEEMEKRNRMHVEMIEDLFEMASGSKSEFTFSQWFEGLSEEKKLRFVEGKRVFLVMLKLFEVETISISEFLKEELINETCNGEFDLSYCLYQILKLKGRRFSLDGFKIEKLNSVFTYQIDKEEGKETIQMNDMNFVVRGEEFERSIENL